MPSSAVTLETAVSVTSTVAFVTATVTHSASTPQRITLGCRCPEAAWTPRRATARAAWSGRHWQGTVRPGRTVGVGFATPVPSKCAVAGGPEGQPTNGESAWLEQPLEVCSSERVMGDERLNTSSESDPQDRHDTAHHDDCLGDLPDWQPDRRVIGRRSLES